MNTYRIVRYYQRPGVQREVLATNKTYEEVTAHCSDPETASNTCKKPENIRRTQQRGEWFDGWERES